jgi:hypothetical protein
VAAATIRGVTPKIGKVGSTCQIIPRRRENQPCYSPGLIEVSTYSCSWQEW